MTDAPDLDGKQLLGLILEAVRQNTGGEDEAQPAAISERALYTTLAANGRLDPRQLSRGIDLALDRGDLIRYTDEEGESRLCIRRQEPLLRLVEELRESTSNRTADHLLLALTELLHDADDDVDDWDIKPVIGAANEARQHLQTLEG